MADTYIALLVPFVASGVLVCFPTLAPAVGLPTRLGAMKTLPSTVACALTVVVVGAVWGASPSQFLARLQRGYNPEPFFPQWKAASGEKVGWIPVSKFGLGELRAHCLCASASHPCSHPSSCAVLFHCEAPQICGTSMKPMIS